MRNKILKGYCTQNALCIKVNGIGERKIYSNNSFGYIFEFKEFYHREQDHNFLFSQLNSQSNSNLVEKSQERPQ